MKTKLASVLVALSAFPLSVALAQEPMTPTPADVSYSSSWTGLYVGVQGGSTFSTEDNGRLVFDNNLDGNYNDSIAAFGNNFDGSFDSGLSYGLHIGYDYQMGRWVVGGLADINKVDVRQRQSGFSSTPAFYIEERDIDTLGTVRARAGYLVTDNLLVFATAGFAFADDNYRMLSNTPATVATSGSDGNDTPYVLGVGIETRITPRVSLALEYLYYNLGDSDFVTNLSGPAAFSTVAASTNTRGSDRDFDFQKIQAKISYRF